jgi:hypothetical protein
MRTELSEVKYITCENIEEVEEILEMYQVLFVDREFLRKMWEKTRDQFTVVDGKILGCFPRYGEENVIIAKKLRIDKEVSMPKKLLKIMNVEP